MSIKARITVGDWSGDGHNETDVIDILIPEGLTAKSKGWDQSGYIKGTTNKTWGCSDEPDLWFYFDLAMRTHELPNLKKYCEDYEDSRMPYADLKEIYEKLGKGINESDFEFDDEEEEDEDRMVYMNTDTFAHVWLDYVNEGIKLNGEVGEVKSYKQVKEKVLNYNIGGYGLLGG